MNPPIMETCDGLIDTTYAFIAFTVHRNMGG